MDLSIEHTRIPGLLVVRRPVHRDARGWFTESWQRAKMVAAGLPDFAPVQHNISYNSSRGATRGIHAEPWDKFVTVVHGRVFGAWVDLRAGEGFGATVTLELDESTAVFVPRGVGNSYQALADETVYSYLVNEHWRPDLTYPALALDDPTAAIEWPIPSSRSEISDKDRANPRLAEVAPSSRGRRSSSGAAGRSARPCADSCPTPSRRAATSSTSPTPPPSKHSTSAATTWSSMLPR